MKPRIFKQYGMWACRGVVGHYQHTMHGVTPKQAYDEYKRIMNDHIANGVANAINKPGK